LDKAAKYVHETYGGNTSKWDDDTKKLSVFILGLNLHYITDLVWHGLSNSSQGFINYNANTCFNRSYQRGHDNSDVGGDIMLL
jgi:hypothetical protein